jgi:hypothetical protein
MSASVVLNGLLSRAVLRPKRSMIGSVSGAVRPELEVGQWVGWLDHFRDFAFSARRRRPRCRRVPFDPRPALPTRDRIRCACGEADWPSRSVMLLIDDSVFGVVELRCADGFGPGQREYSSRVALLVWTPVLPNECRGGIRRRTGKSDQETVDLGSCGHS